MIGTVRSVTTSTEDYLKAIWSLSESQREREAGTNDLAESLGVSPPAISKMLKQLKKLGLVAHTPYRGVRLTKRGRSIALRTIRRHRLLERYLAESLAYPLESVHSEAERLEHHISDEFERRIDALLGHPKYCPHGSPIPTEDGHIPEMQGQPLSELELPTMLRVERITTGASDLSNHLHECGIVPGMTLQFLKREPFDGDLHLKINGRPLRLSCQAAKSVIVVATHLA